MQELAAVYAKDGKHRIMVAESNDGISWTKQGLVLDVGSAGGPESDDSVPHPGVLRLGAARSPSMGVLR